MFVEHMVMPLTSMELPVGGQAEAVWRNIPDNFCARHLFKPIHNDGSLAGFRLSTVAQKSSRQHGRG